MINNRNYITPDADGSAPTRVARKLMKWQTILNDKNLNIWQKKFKLDELDAEFPDVKLSNPIVLPKVSSTAYRPIKPELGGEPVKPVTAPAPQAIRPNKPNLGDVPVKPVSIAQPRKADPAASNPLTSVRPNFGGNTFFTKPYTNNDAFQENDGKSPMTIDSDGAFHNATMSNIANYFVYGIGNANKNNVTAPTPGPTQPPNSGPTQSPVTPDMKPMPGPEPSEQPGTPESKARSAYRQAEEQSKQQTKAEFVAPYLEGLSGYLDKNDSEGAQYYIDLYKEEFRRGGVDVEQLKQQVANQIAGERQRANNPNTGLQWRHSATPNGAQGYVSDIIRSHTGGVDDGRYVIAPDDYGGYALIYYTDKDYQMLPLAQKSQRGEALTPEERKQAEEYVAMYKARGGGKRIEHYYSLELAQYVADQYKKQISTGHWKSLEGDAQTLKGFFEKKGVAQEQGSKELKDYLLYRGKVNDPLAGLWTLLSVPQTVYSNLLGTATEAIAGKPITAWKMGAGWEDFSQKYGAATGTKPLSDTLNEAGFIGQAGNFALNMAGDPWNLVGAGAGKGILSARRRLGLTEKAQNTYEYYKAAENALAKNALGKEGVGLAKSAFDDGLGPGEKKLVPKADAGKMGGEGENIYKPSQSVIGEATKGAGGVGNLKSIRGLNDFKSRIPSSARELPWRNIDGGATEGVRYRWTDTKGNVWNVRAHSIDPSAPLGSNASKGWVYRVEVRWGGTGKKYFMDSSGNFHSENVINPNSPMYNEVVANDTHIILGDR